MKTIHNQIYLRGNFEEGNFGDDALLVANVLLARRYNFIVSLLGAPSPYADDRFVPNSALEADIRPPCLIQYGGGTQFFSLPRASSDGQAALTSIAAGHQAWNDRKPTAARLALALRQPRRLIRSAQARLRRRRIAALPHSAIGLGVGPFTPEDADDEANVATLLRKMAFLWVRDQSSADFCRRHGMTNVVLSADLCFTSPFQTLLNVDPFATAPDAHNRIGIVLRDHPSLDGAFHKKIFALAHHLRSSGREVEFLSFSCKADRFVSQYRACGEKVIQWNPRNCRIEQFCRKLAGYSVLLTARFHGGIFGVINRTPFIVIGVDEKLSSLASRYPEAQISTLPPAAGLDLYLRSIDEQVERIENTKKALANHLLQERALACTGEEAYARFLAAASGNTVINPALLSSVPA